MRHAFLIILITLVITSCTHTYYIVRHAEKAQANSGVAMSSPNDPPLTEAGKQRAEKLKDLLKNKKIRYIFSTNFNRTLSTAKPLSDAIGVTTTIYDARKDSALIAQLKTLKKNTLIVGHSNTIDDIVNRLCNEKKVPGDIEDAVYDNLFVVKYKGKKIYFEARKY